MKNLADFFGKFQSKIAGQVQNLIIISEILKKHTGIHVEMKDIRISSGTLFLKTSSVEKNVIFIKKERILGEINQKARSLTLKDIR